LLAGPTMGSKRCPGSEEAGLGDCAAQRGHVVGDDPRDPALDQELGRPASADHPDEQSLDLVAVVLAGIEVESLQAAYGVCDEPQMVTEAESRCSGW
jgi:hypothetical protein